MVKQIVGMVLVAVAVTFAVPGVVIVPKGISAVNMLGSNVPPNSGFRDKLLDRKPVAGSFREDGSLQDLDLDNLLAGWHGRSSLREQIGLTQQSQLENLGDLTVL